jgi:hypothetical protein
LLPVVRISVRNGWVGASRPSCVNSDKAGMRSLSVAMKVCKSCLLYGDFGKGKSLLSQESDFIDTQVLH